MSESTEPATGQPMMPKPRFGVFGKARWSPFVVGAGIGVLSWITFGLMGKALGASTTFVRLDGLLISLFSPEHVQNNAYYARYFVADGGGAKAVIEWQMLLVIGMAIGAFVSAKLGRTHEVEHVPQLWQWRFGRSKAVRYVAAFIGGVLLLFGARMAGGCTSGHGISGGLQFAVGSWVFFGSFFLAGIIAAFAIYGKAGRNHV